jgi:hypothetical protein
MAAISALCHERYLLNHQPCLADARPWRQDLKSGLDQQRLDAGQWANLDADFLHLTGAFGVGQSFDLCQQRTD